MDRRPEVRRPMTLSEQLLSEPAGPAIRDFLGVPHDDDDEEDRSPSTLMDAISRDESGGGGGIINWKPLRDRLRLRRCGGAWRTTTTPSPKPAAAVTNRGASGGGDRGSKYSYSPGEVAAAFSRDTSTRVDSTSTSSRRGVADGDEEGAGNEDEDDEEPAAKMSLMTLLEQADNQWDDDDGGGAPPTNSLAGVDDDAMGHVCCVCMVRHKGAAFIPCGHTFCRHCSRELWLSRGNCPLCNIFIHEILDIF